MSHAMRVNLIFSTAVSICLAAGAAPAADWLYLTQPGDTLIGIGQQYLKNPADWPRIQVVNTVADPRRLPANTRIRIPVGLLKVTPAPVTVTAVNGNVRVKTADGPFQALAANALLKGGETVLTGPGGSAAYRFADGTTLTQQASSKLAFGRLAAYGRTGMVSTELTLDSGRLEASAARQQPPAGGFRVTTPVAVAGLRGTGFRLNVDEAGKTLRNEVLEGAVGVSAQGREVRVEGGFGTVTEAGKPPAPPRALRARPNLAGLPERVRRLPLAFTWQPDMPAAAWRAQVAADAVFGSVLLEGLFPGPTAQWSEDLPDGDYVLRVRGVDEAGLEGFDSLHAFTLDARPLPPLPVAPALGERLYVNDATLAWAAAAGAQGYLIQIAPTPAFDSGVLERRLPAQLSHRETLPDGEWHWRAASLDEAGQPHCWSPHRAFRVQPLPGAPAGGEARAADGHARLAWSTAKGAARYGVEISAGADMKAPLVRLETDQTAASAALKPGKYFWRVRGLEADGQAGAWSPASPVILPPGTPTEVTARMEGYQLVAGWKGEADAYRVELSADAGFAQPVLRQRVAEARLAVVVPKPGDYWLRVFALGADGVESPPSAPLAVAVKQAVPWWLLLFFAPML
jgi:hypothetical protein